MRGLIAVVAATLLATVDEVAAWGNRGGPNGPPGHYGGPQEHGCEFQPDHILRVTTANITIACQERESVLINGTSPGPPLRLKPGVRQWVRVYNDMCEENVNTTIHWHGLSQRLAPFSDGTPQASMWPIPPCHYFDFEVFPLKKEAGTYFYHSHVGFQAVSAAGPLIIEDEGGVSPYEYDEERLVFLSDYYNHTDHHIEQGLLAQPFVWSNETNAILINGVGVAQEEQHRSGEEGCPLPVIEVEPGKTYRFRFVGSLAISMVELGIDEHHNFTIIEADGSYTKPHSEEHMQLTSGQRFDTIFTAKTEAQLNGKRDYYIKLETNERPKKYIGYGVLRYSGGQPEITKNPESAPFNFTGHSYDWAEYALEPLHDNDFPTADEVTRRIELDNRQVSTASIVWRVNGLEWNETTNPQPGDVPYLVDIYQRGQAAMPDYDAAIANGGWDPTTFTFPAKLGEVRLFTTLILSLHACTYTDPHSRSSKSSGTTRAPSSKTMEAKTSTPSTHTEHTTTTLAAATAPTTPWRMKRNSQTTSPSCVTPPISIAGRKKPWQANALAGALGDSASRMLACG